MLSKAQLKFIRSLRLKKFRQQHRAFVVESEKMVRELLQSAIEIKGIYAEPSWLQANPLPPDTGFPVTTIDRGALQKLSQLKTPQPVLAVAKLPETSLPPALPRNQLCLALDRIRDPGNLGTLLRTADWFGVEWVICSPGCVDPFNPKVVQASMGALFRVKVAETGLQDFLSRKDQPPVYAATLDGVNIFKHPPLQPGILLIGNESIGIEEDLLAGISHQKIGIPRYGQAESLNAAVAAAILLAVMRAS